jgi:hypothetical protein
MRFSLRWLFVAILLITVSIVALLNANEYWAGASRSVVILLLSLAAVFALLASAGRRAFWLGFVVVGVAQFASIRFADSKYESDVAYKYLVTDRVIAWMHERVLRDVEIVVPHEYPDGQVRPAPIIVKRPHQHLFFVVGRCVLTLLFALVGGFVATWFYRRNTNP